MSPTKESAATVKEVEILQDIFIFLLLDASVPQQAARKIVKVDLNRITRIGKLIRSRQKDQSLPR